jgi:hypothetical protein
MSEKQCEITAYLSGKELDSSQQHSCTLGYLIQKFLVKNKTAVVPQPP